MLHRGKNTMDSPSETMPSERKATVEPASGMNSDDEQLEAMGHVQELRRNFSIWSIVALQISLMATWEALSTVVSAALTSGGAPCLFYNYVITFIGSMFIVISLGEIASYYPTAGGQYHWVFCLSPAKYRMTAAWFTGWITIGAQLVFTASSAFAAGLQLQGLITLNHLDTYVPTRWQGMLFYDAVLVYAIVINIWGSKFLPHVNTGAGILHVVGFVAFLLVFAIMAPKHSSNYVFLETSNATGWSSDGIAWLIGLLTTVYPLLGYDAACHLSEELPMPSRNVPLAMVGSVFINGVIGVAYTVILAFSLGDLTELLSSPTGFPFFQLCLNVTKSPAGATLMCLVLCLVAVMANGSCLTSTSRTAWAFARDNGLPASKYLSNVHPTLKVPIQMIIVLTILQLILGLIYLGSSTAFNAVLSMAIFGLYGSYLTPIVLMLFFGGTLRAKNHSGLSSGMFRMSPRTGAIVNIVAIVWLVFVMVFSTFPTLQPVTSGNMNYCVVVMMGWVIIGIFYYFLWGRSRFSGPKVELS